MKNALHFALGYDAWNPHPDQPLSREQFMVRLPETEPMSHGTLLCESSEASVATAYVRSFADCILRM